MATIEERLTALEQENVGFKKTIELQTIALRALATKDALEDLRHTINAVLDALISHDQLTNERLGDQQIQIIELDGKVVGLQVETRQGFKDTKTQIVELDGKVVGQQTEMRQRFEQQNITIVDLQTEMQQRFEQQDIQIIELRGDVSTQGQKLDQILLLLNTLMNKPEQNT